MAASLLAALSLPPPSGGLPAPPLPSGPAQPTGPIRAPGVTPREELAQPPKAAPQPPPGGPVPTNLQMRKPAGIGTGGLPPHLRPKANDGQPPPNEPSDAQIKEAIDGFKADMEKGAVNVANVAAKISDRARRDPLVRALRDGLATIQPFTSDKKAKEALNKALDALVEKGLSKGFLALMELTLGKKAGKVSRPDLEVPGSGVKPDEAPGEVIVTKDFPIGKTGTAAYFSFEGAPLHVRVGQSIDLVVHTPSRWNPKEKRWQDTAVVVGRAENQTSGPVLRSKPVKAKGRNAVSLPGLDAAGEYVIYVVSGVGAENRPVHALKVT